MLVMEKKIETRHFYSCLSNKTLPQVLILTPSPLPKAEGNYLAAPTHLFLKSIPQTGRGSYGNYGQCLNHFIDARILKYEDIQ